MLWGWHYFIYLFFCFELFAGSVLNWGNGEKQNNPVQVIMLVFLPFFFFFILAG